jgi:hypothetical protein
MSSLSGWSTSVAEPTGKVHGRRGVQGGEKVGHWSGGMMLLRAV